MTIVVPQLRAADDSANEMLLSDFTPGSADLGWYVVNDTVMGGRSEGAFEEETGTLVFTGRTNTSGGGFSSIRTQAMRLDVSGLDGIRLRVKGDGRRYTWRLTTDARWRGRQVAYWADFETRKGAWITADIPFSRFIPRFRGYELEGPPLDAGQITGMGLMIYDTQDGPFELHLASVGAYSEEPSFTLQQYRWKNRVLVVSAASGEDADLEAQRDDVALTQDEFADRDMVLVTLLDGELSTAGSRELSNEEAAAARETLDIRPGMFVLKLIGKDGSVKLSTNRATPMSEIYALIDGMPMRQREQSDR